MLSYKVVLYFYHFYILLQMVLIRFISFHNQVVMSISKKSILSSYIFRFRVFINFRTISNEYKFNSVSSKASIFFHKCRNTIILQHSNLLHFVYMVTIRSITIIPICLNTISWFVYVALLWIKQNVDVKVLRI